MSNFEWACTKMHVNIVELEVGWYCIRNESSKIRPHLSSDYSDLNDRFEKNSLWHR